MLREVFGGGQLMAHVCNPSTWEARQEHHEMSLGYTSSLSNPPKKCILGYSNSYKEPTCLTSSTLLGVFTRYL
jgi:hypothetical protein